MDGTCADMRVEGKWSNFSGRPSLMRIATWNVNNVRKRLPHLLAWLDATKPDAVALQELKSTEAEFPRAEIEKAGYGALVVGQKTWNGVALLARGAEPLPVLRALPPGTGKNVSRRGPGAAAGGAQPSQTVDLEARYCEAAIHGVIVAGLYAPNGNPWPGPKFDNKLAWMQRLQQRADELRLQGVPAVLAGDFNVVPTDDTSDIYATRSYADNALLQPGPRAAFRQLQDSGWTDAVRHLHPHPKPPMYTFWGFMRNRWARDAGLRIDHLLVSGSLLPALQAAGVDKAVRGLEDPSDHAPVWIELDMEASHDSMVRPDKPSRRSPARKSPGP